MAMLHPLLPFLNLIETSRSLCPPAAFAPMLTPCIAYGHSMLMTFLLLPQYLHHVMCHLAQYKILRIALPSLEAKPSKDSQEALWGS